MNQAQRHLWARAYNQPVLIVEVPVPVQPQTLLVNAKPRRHRILVAKPRQRKEPIRLSQGPQEAEKNLRITEGLERIFGADKMNAVLAQANSLYHVTNPLAENNPEPYELFENGQIDQALEYFGTSWVIGRPRLDP